MWVGTALHWAGVEAAKPTQLFVHKHSFNQIPPKNYEKNHTLTPKSRGPPLIKEFFVHRQLRVVLPVPVCRQCHSRHLGSVQPPPSHTGTTPQLTILIHLLSLSAMLNISINLTDRCQIFGHREVFSSGHLGFLWEAK